MSDYEEPISNEEKASIAVDFINHAPPGEVEDVLRDVRVLLNDDHAFQEVLASTLSKYRQVQFHPAESDGVSTLITPHGLMDNGKFIDPASSKSFRFDFLRKIIDQVEVEEPSCSGDCEAYRQALQGTVEKYVKEYFPAGVIAVYGKQEGSGMLLTACIEDHKFSPSNFWNGKWRSEWKIEIKDGQAEITGVLKTQVHYYEDGNVQLVSQKECKDSIKANDENQVAEDVAKMIAKCEVEYQTAVFENYKVMSYTTFKALRRQLPVTRTKIDWNKILGYQIGKEIGGK